MEIERVAEGLLVNAETYRVSDWWNGVRASSSTA